MADDDNNELDGSQSVSKGSSEAFKTIGKKVMITCVDKRKFFGYVYTVDPVSYSLVIAETGKLDCELQGSELSYEDKHRTSSKIKQAPSVTIRILSGDAIKQVTEIHQDSDTQTWKYLEKHIIDFKSDSNSLSVRQYDSNELEKRKTAIKNWIQNHRLPVEETEDNVLSVMKGLVSIEPPYGTANCQSTNTIVLGRIQDLIDSFHS